MADLPFDAQERIKLCDLFDELGPSAPTLIEGWTAHDLAAHIVLRERRRRGSSASVGSVRSRT